MFHTEELHYMQEANMLSNRFIQLLYTLMMGQYGSKHLAVSYFWILL